MREEGAGLVRPGTGGVEVETVVRPRGRACGRKAEQEGKGKQGRGLKRPTEIDHTIRTVFLVAPPLSLYSITYCH
jgi:hypothetical protein